MLDIRDDFDQQRQMYSVLVLHFIDDPDAFMRSFLLAHPDFLANELAKGGKSAQRAQLCIDSGFAPAEALPKA